MGQAGIVVKCNIDAKGKAVRLIMGSVFEAIGLLLLVLAWVGVLEGRWPWYAGVACVLYGVFGIFEGIAGWCIVRAMGIKTRM